MLCLILNKNLEIYSQQFVILIDSGYIQDGYQPLKIILIIKCFLINLKILGNNLAFIAITNIFLYNKNIKIFNKSFFDKISIKIVTGFPWYIFLLVLNFYFIVENANNSAFTSKKKSLKLRVVVFIKRFFISFNVLYYTKISSLLLKLEPLKIIVKNKKINLSNYISIIIKKY